MNPKTFDPLKHLKPSEPLKKLQEKLSLIMITYNYNYNLELEITTYNEI